MTKQLATGYIAYVEDQCNITETHYAVLPDGTILVASGFRLNCHDFGPRKAEDWGHASSLSPAAGYCGNYYV
jgi:hypothetical protein